VLVGEVGVCEGVARRHGRRRHNGPDGTFRGVQACEILAPRTPLRGGFGSALGFA
jgi:hypothetical protein